MIPVDSVLQFQPLLQPLAAVYSTPGAVTDEAAGYRDEVFFSPDALRILGEDEAPTDPPLRDALGGDPASYYLSQLRSPHNPNEDQLNKNRNCGPASLAMVLKAFGAEPPDLKNPGDTNEFIEKTRLAMGGGTDESVGTTVDMVIDGAVKSGLNARKLKDSSLDEIDKALAAGELVVAPGVPKNGNFSWDRFSGGHLLAVVGKTERDGQTYYIINDPYSTRDPKTGERDYGPHLVTPEQLSAYLTGPGAAISKPRPELPPAGPTVPGKGSRHEPV
ncbi:MAG: C39 family peptidase [Armatimonadetes bacterium]|nr:C39 family peptidase [Armatimonadota bacterium]